MLTVQGDPVCRNGMSPLRHQRADNGVDMFQSTGSRANDNLKRGVFVARRTQNDGIVVLRATCSIQHESGWQVMPPKDTRRLPTSMKNST